MITYSGTSQGALPFLARFLISLIFLISGIGKIIDFSGAVLALKQVGVHQGAEIFIGIALFLELLGGLLVLLGWYTRVGCWILMIFLFPTTLLFHAFWRVDGANVALQLSLLLKNLVIYGALLLLQSYGPGRWSMDALWQQTDTM
jgi:putative oxidoreductase